MFSKKNSSSNDASLKNVETVIGGDCEIIGDIKVGNSIKIDGMIQGKIFAKGDVIIGEKGKVKGDIECNELNIHGNVEGDVNVDTLRLRPSSTLLGNIKAVTLEVEHGSKYQGNVVMITEEPAIQPIDDINPKSYDLVKDNKKS